MSSGGPKTRVLSVLLLVITLGMTGVEAIVNRDRQMRMRISTSNTRMFSATTRTEDIQPQLALLTFDLDDTLFPIGPVVQDANDAMIRAMHSLGYPKATNKNVLRHSSAIRKNVKYPITYTSLRMLAIQQELKSHLKKQETVDQSVVKHCFDAWLNERHASAERNLFPGALEMLECVSEQHPYACIAAITNGRGDPKYMNCISHFFDFCVSGEDDDVFPQRKPQRGIYETSLAKFEERYPYGIGESRIWCHVGDCLANDVGASASCGAYGIWMEADHEDVTESRDKKPFWSTASKRTIRNRERLGRTGKAKVSAKITDLSELPSAIDKLLEKVAQQQQKQGARAFKMIE